MASTQVWTRAPAPVPGVEWDRWGAAVTALLRPDAVTYSLTGGAKVGASGAGWVVDDATNRAGLAKLPASQTAEELVVKVTGLYVGQVITGYTVRGQIESSGGAVTLDAELRRITVAAGNLADAAVTSGAITQVSVTADTAVAAEVTGLSETVAAGVSYYLLLTGTTAAATDIDLASIDVTATRP